MKLTEEEIRSPGLFPKAQVESFFRTKRRGGEYLQMARLANAPPALFVPVVNSLLLGLASLEDVAGIPVMNKDSVDAFVSTVMARGKLHPHQENEYLRRRAVYEPADPDDPETLGHLGLGEDLLPLDPAPWMGIGSLLLRFELFYEKRSYRSYISLSEMEGEFSSRVLPGLLEGLGYGTVADAFPSGTDAEAHFASVVQDQGVLVETVRAYNSIFGRYLDCMSDAHVHKLLISSSVLRSKAECHRSHAESLLNWGYPGPGTASV
jgi:hypothetical protein